MRIYLVRHGRTEYNEKGIVQGGEVNSDLTEVGIEGALQAGEKLKEVNFDKVYASPLGRTMATAKYLLKGQGKSEDETIYPLEGFKEFMFGSWEGKKVSELKEHPQYFNLKQAPEKYDPTEMGGETYSQLVARSYAELEKLAKHHAESDTVLVVSHAVTITTLLKYLQGYDVADYRRDGLVDNTSISIVETCDKGKTWQVLKING